MNEQSFLLIPFPEVAAPDVSITGNVSRQGNMLAVQYSLVGNIDEIALPARPEHPSRRDDLWKKTCFEFFLAVEKQPHYWEFNLAPSGDWNVYRMDTYRRIGFREETSIQGLQLETQTLPDLITLKATVDLSSILEVDDLCQMGITAVIQTKNGRETYWALAHPAPQADFHLRESFILLLAGQTHPAGQSAPAG
jgi:hypothetical protein